MAAQQAAEPVGVVAQVARVVVAAVVVVAEQPEAAARVALQAAVEVEAEAVVPLLEVQQVAPQAADHPQAG